MKVIKLVSAAFAVGFVAIMVFIIYDIGRMHGASRERDKAECGCGHVESCAFGPGIVGRRYCSYDRTWSRCEPDPKHAARRLP